MNKRNVAIVCGGDSSEYEVSLRSAQGLYSFFDKERYHVYIVTIKSMDWRVQLKDGTDTKIDQNTLDFLKKVSAGGSKVYGGFGISNGGQAKALASSVEAIVAGSVFVRIITENKADAAKLAEKVEEKARELTQN